MIAAIFDELKLPRLVPIVSAGLVNGVQAIIISASYANLVFSGPLEVHLVTGIGIMVFSVMVASLLSSFFSSNPGMIGALAGPPVMVLGLMVSSVFANLQTPPEMPVVMFTLIVVIGLSTVLTGCFYLFLGVFNLGELVRYIPYPVIGGILAGVALLLLRGGFQTASGVTLTILGLTDLFQPPVALHWIPALAFAILLFATLRRSEHFAIMPLFIVGGIMVFYAVALTMGQSLESLRAGGWLLGNLPDSGLWRPPSLASLYQADWGVIVTHIPDLATLLLVSVVSLLLSNSAFEITTRQDIDLNRELKSTGAANILSGMLGGMSGGLNLTLSSTSKRMGAPYRATGLVCALVCASVLIFGGGALTLIPKPVVGGFLMFIGLNLLVVWVYDSWFHLPRGDYLVVVLIMVCVGAWGYLQGVAVGIIAGTILFIVNYSRIHVVKHTLSGANFHSHVDRPEAAKKHLREAGDAIYILKLQGFIFFGTANRLLNQVRMRIGERSSTSLAYLLLDFRLVTGLDSSSIISFVKLHQYSETHGFLILLTNIPPELTEQLKRGGFAADTDGRVTFFPDLHRGLQWCEDRLLYSEDPLLIDYEDRPLIDHFRLLLGGGGKPEHLIAYLEKIELEPGGVLIHQGEPSKDLFFIAAGYFRVELNEYGDHPVLVRTIAPGTFVGEVAFYLQLPRSATIVAEGHGVAYRLSSETLANMEKNDPELAASLHQVMARVLAERLSDTDKLLQELLD